MTTLEESTIRASLEPALEFRDEEYRYAYAEDFLNTWIATQIVILREQRGLSQSKFGELIGTKQPGVSRLENVNHSTWKCETLKRIARALGVRLKITFETFGTLLDEDRNFSREYLKRPSFADDPVFSGAADDLETSMSRLLGKTPATNVTIKEEVGPGIAAFVNPAGNTINHGATWMTAAPLSDRFDNSTAMTGYISQQSDTGPGARWTS